MRKRQVAVMLLGFVAIFLFFTPLRSDRDAYWIRHETLMSNGFIDYGRLFLYLIIWAGFAVGLQFADFTFLKNERLVFLARRTGSRLIDLSFVIVAAAIGGSLFFIVDLSGVMSAIAAPVLFLVFWLLYFVFLFKEGRTTGDKVCDLVQIGQDANPIGKRKLFVRELIYVIPAFLFLMTAGVFYATNYWADEVTITGGADALDEVDYLKQDILEAIAGLLWAVILILYAIFPLAMLFNKRRQGVVDILTKTVVTESFDRSSEARQDS